MTDEDRAQAEVASVRAALRSFVVEMRRADLIRAEAWGRLRDFIDDQNQGVDKKADSD